jgi:hypothetical protein
MAPGREAPGIPQHLVIKEVANLVHDRELGHWSRWIDPNSDSPPTVCLEPVLPLESRVIANVVKGDPRQPCNHVNPVDRRQGPLRRRAQSRFAREADRGADRPRLVHEHDSLTDRWGAGTIVYPVEVDRSAVAGRSSAC